MAFDASEDYAKLPGRVLGIAGAGNEDHSGHQKQTRAVFPTQSPQGRRKKARDD